MKKQIRQIIKMAAQNFYLPAVYALYRHKKTDKDLVIFADAHHMTRPENMDLLYEALLARGKKVEEIYLDYQKVPYLQVLRSMTYFMKRYAMAGTVVICDNFLPASSCRKKKETRLVQLWHACGALKRFGYDTADDIPPSYRGNVFRGIDLVTVSAPFCVKPFASAMRLAESAVEAVGVSRTDRYFDRTWQETCAGRFRQEHPEAFVQTTDGERKKQIVLWAPTFRGSAADPEWVGPDLLALQKQLGDDYLVLASLHPHMMHKLPERQQKALPLCRLRTEEMFAVTDVLIADYSSLIFEYCLTGQALVLYTPDYDAYTDKRGFYMDYRELPGEQIFEESRLADAVRTAAAQGMDPEKRAQFLEKYMCACDGNATERIADKICV